MLKRSKPILVILAIILILILLATATLQRNRLSHWLLHVTGEEQWLPQVRGLWQLASNVTRPLPDTADDVPVAHAGVDPFGINVFLEQEVEPAKRERILQMVSEAGFHWIRQEFPWEDIEIEGKGDFEEQRGMHLALAPRPMISRTMGTLSPPSSVATRAASDTTKFGTSPTSILNGATTPSIQRVMSNC